VVGLYSRTLTLTPGPSPIPKPSPTPTPNPNPNPPTPNPNPPTPNPNPNPTPNQVDHLPECPARLQVWGGQVRRQPVQQGLQRLLRPRLRRPCGRQGVQRHVLHGSAQRLSAGTHLVASYGCNTSTLSVHHTLRCVHHVHVHAHVLTMLPLCTCCVLPHLLPHSLTHLLA